jgi:hypothetical protein
MIFGGIYARLKKKSTSLGLAARIAAPAATARPNEGGNTVLEPGTPVEEAGGGAAALDLKRGHISTKPPIGSSYATTATA